MLPDYLKVALLVRILLGSGGGGGINPSEIAYELEAIIDMIEAGLIELELVGADEDDSVFGEEGILYTY